MFFLAALAGFAAQAQPYSGERKFDGTHRDIVEGYLMGGSNVVTGGFAGEAVTYTRHLTERWSVSAGEQAQFFKQLYDDEGDYLIRVDAKADGGVSWSPVHMSSTKK